MDRSKLIRLFHTLKFLKPVQVYYRAYYFVRDRLIKNQKYKALQSLENSIAWASPLLNNDSYLGSNTFRFLNLEKKFESTIDWNYSGYGKLWTYNLNYFDYINQQTITKADGLTLIQNYIQRDHVLKDGLASYPISLRGINWIKFLSKHGIKNAKINHILYNHYLILLRNLEYHLLGNHLLENGFSLLFGACYFKNKKLYKTAYKILIDELSEQILEDGGHFELSPMYHQILLSRLLDCINLLKNNKWINDDLPDTLIRYSQIMLSWLKQLTFQDGSIPMLNDATYDIAPSSTQLFLYAEKLSIDYSIKQLADSGYRKFKTHKYESIIDIGNIGPDYIPGHAHADTFNFVLHIDNKPLIVDTGISTYEKNKLRQRERGTNAHNTVIIDGRDQSEVCAGFRVGRRAKITGLKEQKNYAKVTHDGYKILNILHTRVFDIKRSVILIEDTISRPTDKEQIALFHFHPRVIKVNILEKEIFLLEDSIKITFNKGVYKIDKEEYEYSMGFNKKEKAIRIKVFFNEKLETKIHV